MLDVAALQVAAGHDVAFFGDGPPGERCRCPTSGPSRPTWSSSRRHRRSRARSRASARMLWSSSAARGMETVLEDFRSRHRAPAQHLPPALAVDPAAGAPARHPGGHDAARLQARVSHVPAARSRRSSAKRASPRRFWEPRRAPLQRWVAAPRARLHAVELSLHTVGGAYGPSASSSVRAGSCSSKMRAGQGVPRPAAVDTQLRRSWTRSCRSGAGRRRVVFAGRLSDEKGVDVLIEAMAQLPGGRLDVAGDGPAGRRWRR